MIFVKIIIDRLFLKSRKTKLSTYYLTDCKLRGGGTIPVSFIDVSPAPETVPST